MPENFPFDLKSIRANINRACTKDRADHIIAIGNISGTTVDRQIGGVIQLAINPKSSRLNNGVAAIGIGCTGQRQLAGTQLC